MLLVTMHVLIEDFRVHALVGYLQDVIVCFHLHQDVQWFVAMVVVMEVIGVVLT